MRRAGLGFGLLGVRCSLTRPRCALPRLGNRWGPGGRKDVGARSPVLGFYKHDISFPLLQESGVDLGCCVDLQKHTK